MVSVSTPVGEIPADQDAHIHGIATMGITQQGPNIEIPTHWSAAK